MNPAETVRAIPDIVESDNDSFEIMSLLGQGGMGLVYKARQGSLDRIVALKMIHSQVLLNPQSVQRLKREAKAAATVSHPNIVKVFSIDTWQNCPFIVMEFVEGRTLAEVLEERQKLPPEEVYEIFSQVLSALQCIHKANFVHRDIKPSNILVTTSGITKLMDFGIAKEVIDASQAVPGGQKVTQTGAMVGSPWFMSPEQCSAATVDARSDLYSVGCTMYQTLSGQLPFSGENPLEVMLQHLHAQAETLGGSTDPKLADIVAMAMEKDPSKRFQNADDFIEALQSARGGEYPSRRPKAVARGSAITRRRVNQIALVGTLLCAGGLAAFLLGSMLQPPSSNSDAEGSSAMMLIEKAAEALRAAPAGDPIANQDAERFLRAALRQAKAEHNGAAYAWAVNDLARLFATNNNPKEAEPLFLQAAEATDEAFKKDLKQRAFLYKSMLSGLNTSKQYQNFNRLRDRGLKPLEEQAKQSDLPYALIAMLTEEDCQRSCNLGNSVDALRLAKQAVAQYERGEDTEQTGCMSDRHAGARVRLMTILNNQAKWDDLVKVANRSIKLSEKPVEANADLLTPRVSFYQSLADGYANLQKRAECEASFEQASKLSVLANRPPSEIAANLFVQSHRIFQLGDMPSALSLVKQCLVVDRSLKPSLGTATHLMWAANLEHASRNYPAAVRHANETYEMSKTLNQPSLAYEAKSIAGSANYLMNHPEEAITQLAAAAEMEDQLPVPNIRIRFNIERYWALSLMALERWQEAQKHLELALDEGPGASADKKTLDSLDGAAIILKEHL